jgi:protein-L-isoaspartate O-methyltransferase
LLAAVESRTGALPETYRQAYLAVDRAEFVRQVDRAHAWRNAPLPLSTPHGPEIPSVDELVARYGSYEAALFSSAFSGATATISGPSIYAVSFGLLELQAGDRLLELGTGTGYGAALASEIVGAEGLVTTLEVDPVLVQAARERLASRSNVRVVHADGLASGARVALHTKVYVAFAVQQVPDALLESLPEGGVLIAPVGAKLGGPLPPDAPITKNPARDAQERFAQLRAAGIGQTVMRYRRRKGRLECDATIPALYVTARPMIAAQ